MPGYDTKETSSQLQATMFVSVMKPWQIWNYWYCTEKALLYFYFHYSLCNIATSHLFLPLNMITFIGYTLYGSSCKISWNTWKLRNTYKKVQTISSNIQKIISITLLGHLSLGSLVKSGKMQKEQLLVKFCRHSLTRLPAPSPTALAKCVTQALQGIIPCFMDSFSLTKNIIDFLNNIPSLTGATLNLIY